MLLQWQVDDDSGSFALFALYVNKAVALLDNAVDGCKAHTRAFTNLLGGKKWLNNMWQKLFINTVSGIGDAQRYIIARYGACVPGIYCVLVKMD